MKYGNYYLLAFLLLIGELAAEGADQMPLGDMIVAIGRDLPFDISPRHITFSPQGALRVAVDSYVQTVTAEKILELETELWRAGSGYTAIALGTMLVKLNDDRAKSALKRYVAFLERADDVWDAFPKKQQVLQFLPVP